MLGIVVERVLIRHYYARPKEDQILVTFGLGIVLVETIRAIFSGQTKATSHAAVGGQLRASCRHRISAVPSRRRRDRRLRSSSSWIIIFKTRLGLIVRGGIDDAGIVEILGIDIGRAFMLVFALGASVAGPPASSTRRSPR